MKTLELFAGGGGAALGLKAAGCDAIECLEWEPSAVATLQAAGLPGRVCDLSTMTENDWREWAKKHGSPDLLWSSPPCQAFSKAGKRTGASDPRNGWPWTLAAIDGTRPTWVLCENVPGLLQHSTEHCGDPKRCAGCYWTTTVVPEFRKRFAFVQVFKLNAANFGVPQTRRRVFLIAGPEPVRCPKSTHAEMDQTFGLFETLKPWISISEALGLQVLPRAEGNFKDPNFYAERPAPTVVCSEVKGSSHGAKPEKLQRASDALLLATGRRRLTIQECAILQGFPPDHPFQGTKDQQYRQVGNAVPPKFAEVLARAIVDRKQ